MTWVKINRQRDTLPANIQTDFNGKPIAWQEGKKLLDRPGGEELDYSFWQDQELKPWEREGMDFGGAGTSEYADPPLWKELGYEARFGHIKDIENPGEDVRLALNDIGERIMPKESSGPLAGFGGMIGDIMSNPAGMAMGGALGYALSGAGGLGNFFGGGGGAPGWTSGFDLAGGGALEGMGGAAGALGDFVGSDWASGLSSAMNPGMNMTDFVGSDWAQGLQSAMNPGGQFTTTGAGTDFVGSDWAQGLPGTNTPGLNTATAGGGGGIQSLIQQLMGGAGGQPGTGIPNLLSSLTGLFDLFGTGPHSAQGINDEAAAAADPFGGHRKQSGDMLMNLMTNPGSFSLTPGAKFTMDTGTENLTRSNAARGLLGSGNILADIMQFGEGVASKDYYTMIDKLLPMSGATTGSPASAGAIKSGLLTSRNNALANIGGGLAPVPGSPTNSGGGILQSLGGIGSGISSLLNLFK